MSCKTSLAVSYTHLDVYKRQGKKLHTARSRNDQIAVDIRLYLKKEIAETDHILGQLLDALAKLAKEHTDTVMPGYTCLLYTSRCV